MHSLIIKDIYEMYNLKRKYLVLIAVTSLLPLTYFFAGQGIINSSELLLKFMFLCIPVMICIETTLNQTKELIQDGILELLFINKYVKRENILFSKYIVNVILSSVTAGISVVLIAIISVAMKGNLLNIPDVSFGFAFLLMCVLGTNVGFISSTVFKGKYGAMLYTMLFVSLLLIIFKLFEVFNTYSGSLLIIVLGITAAISFFICFKMFKLNKFMTR